MTDKLRGPLIGQRVKLVDGEYVRDEPEDEAEHFYVCAACDQAVDRRDLGQVIHHETPGHKPIELDG